MSNAPRNSTIREQHRRAIRRTKPPCAICEQPIDYTLPTPHPMSFEVDHVLPLDAAGPDTLENKQACHRKCNREKWHHVGETQHRTFVTHRTW